jgi:hypothetical protein
MIENSNFFAPKNQKGLAPEHLRLAGRAML